MTNCKRPLHVTPSGHPLWRGWHPPTAVLGSHHRSSVPAATRGQQGFSSESIFSATRTPVFLLLPGRAGRERAACEMSPNTARLTAAAPPITANLALRAPGGLSHNSLPRPLGASAHLHPEGLTCVRQWPWSSVMLCCSHTPPSHPCAARPQRPPSFHAADITPRIVG